MFKPGISGNSKGRPKGRKDAFNLGMLEKALKKAAKEHNGVDILQHFVTRAYLDDTVLAALMRKILSDKSNVKMEGQLDLGISPEIAEAIRQKLLERTLKPNSPA